MIAVGRGVDPDEQDVQPLVLARHAVGSGVGPGAEDVRRRRPRRTSTGPARRRTVRRRAARSWPGRRRPARPARDRPVGARTGCRRRPGRARPAARRGARDSTPGAGRGCAARSRWRSSRGAGDRPDREQPDRADDGERDEQTEGETAPPVVRLTESRDQRRQHGRQDPAAVRRSRVGPDPRGLAQGSRLPVATLVGSRAFGTSV